MKKSVFVLAAIFAAAFANAQITLEHTFSGSIDAPTINAIVLGDYYIQKDKTNNIITVYDANDYSVVWSLRMPNNASARLFSTNIFTTDGKFACIVKTIDDSKTDNTRSHLYVYDEEKNIIADLGTAWAIEGPSLVKVSTGYKLHVEKYALDYSSRTTEIYSLPGNGVATDVNELFAPRHNARKYLHNDQVLIDSNERTYNMQGKQVK